MVDMNGIDRYCWVLRIYRCLLCIYSSARYIAMHPNHLLLLLLLATGHILIYWIVR